MESERDKETEGHRPQVLRKQRPSATCLFLCCCRRPYLWWEIQVCGGGGLDGQIDQGPPRWATRGEAGWKSPELGGDVGPRGRASSCLKQVWWQTPVCDSGYSVG